MNNSNNYMNAIVNKKIENLIQYVRTIDKKLSEIDKRLTNMENKLTDIDNIKKDIQMLKYDINTYKYHAYDLHMYEDTYRTRHYLI